MKKKSKLVIQKDKEFKASKIPSKVKPAQLGSLIWNLEPIDAATGGSTLGNIALDQYLSTSSLFWTNVQGKPFWLSTIFS